MLWPNIANCYSKLLEDPSLLWLFTEEEGTSLQELPLLGALHFRIILERFFACIASLAIWGKSSSLISVLGPVERPPHGNSNHRWSRGREPGYGDNLLPSQPKENGDIWHTLCPTPAWLLWAQCSGGKEIYQYPLHSPRNLSTPLPWCQDTLQGHFLHPVPSGALMPLKATSIL